MMKNIGKKRSRKVTGITIFKNLYETEVVCPLCMNEIDNYDKHHVIPHSVGGHGQKWNILAICKNCHSLLTWGDEIYVAHYTTKAEMFMLMNYGLLFYIPLAQVCCWEHGRNKLLSLIYEGFNEGLQRREISKAIELAGFIKFKELNGLKTYEEIKIHWENVWEKK